jgi:hypothetical protein
MTSLQQTAMGGGSATAKTASYVLVAADACSTVIMNSGSSTTITVNTALFAAGDTVLIVNQGAGVCTVTAGTATVNTAGSLALSQYETSILYFLSTSAAILTDYTQSGGMTNPMTTTGDTIYSSSGSTPARLGIGSTGNVLTVAGGVPTWAAPSGGSSFVGCYAFIDSSGYNVANATFATLTFDGEQFDTDGFHSNVTNNSRITIPSGKAGKYLITAQTYFDASGTGKRGLWLSYNGSRTGVSSSANDVGGSSAATVGSQIQIVVNASVSDYFELVAYQNSGGNLFLAGDDYGGADSGRGLTFFQCTYLGA